MHRSFLDLRPPLAHLDHRCLACRVARTRPEPHLGERVQGRERLGDCLSRIRPFLRSSLTDAHGGQCLAMEPPSDRGALISVSRSSRSPRTACNSGPTDIPRGGTRTRAGNGAPCSAPWSYDPPVAPESGSAVVGNARFPDASSRGHGVTSGDDGVRPLRANTWAGSRAAQSAASTGLDNWPFVLSTGLGRRLATADCRRA